MPRGDNPNTTQTTNYTYDRYGNTTGVTLTAGGNLKITSSAVYSDYGNYLTQSINELGKTTTYNYDSVTKLLKYVENANNVHTAYSYDNRDRTTKVYLDTDKDGIPDTAEAQVAYLYANNRLSGIDTATTDYTLTYDAFGNVLTIKAGNYTLATYEYAGNNGKLLKLIYGNGDYEEYIYDELERLVSTKLNGVTEYIVKYDNNGRLYSLTENGATHIYEYDSLDRLIRAWQEDSSGKTIISVENHYDSLGRSSGSTYGDVSSTSQQYNITYKANSNLIETYTMPGNKVNTYTYDEFERLSRKTHSSNVYTTQYAYLTTTEGNTSSLVSRMDIESNAIDTYFTYTYDNLGNIVSIRQNGTVIESYEYDSLGQLTRANNLADNSSTFYEYDKSGNILHKFRFAYTTEPTADMPLAAADEITAYQYTHSGWGDLLSRYGYNGALIHYDEIGNPLNWRNATSLTWEARQLQSISLSETKSLDFEYNSSGIRTKKTYVDLNGDTWEYSYILDGSKIIKEAVHAFTTNSPAAGMYFDLLYYYDDSGIAAVSYNGTKYYYVKNLQGDVIGLVNASGQYVVQYVYDAWGRVVSTTGSMASTLGQYNPFRYRGYYYDRETGWYYLQSRYYDPTVGRFLNADGIIGANGGIEGYNMFAYCNNSPIIGRDVYGYSCSFCTDPNCDGYCPEGTCHEYVDEGFDKGTFSGAFSWLKDVVNDVKKDIENFNIDNEDESIVFESTYFSAYKGKLVIRHNSEFLTSWAIFDTIWLNHNVDLKDDKKKSEILNHEYGHTLQEEEMGLTKYFASVAIPSIVVNVISRFDDEVKKNYYKFPWEADADRRGGVIREELK